MAEMEELLKAIYELNDDLALDILQKVAANCPQRAKEALQTCQAGMNIVGELFEKGEYYVSDLIYAGDMMEQAAALLRPALNTEKMETVGRMILCTVEGDLHDIGKNIVRTFLEAAGFEVLDLGTNVPPEKILETARVQNISIIGLSGLLSVAIEGMKKTVDAFKAAHLQHDVKIVVGGGAVSDGACEMIGANAWALNAADTVRICKAWVSEG